MLQDLLTLNIFQFLLVFSRFSIIFLLFPGISAVYVPVRLRLLNTENSPRKFSVSGTAFRVAAIDGGIPEIPVLVIEAGTSVRSKSMNVTATKSETSRT